MKSSSLTFITGNKDKAEQLSRHIGYKVLNKKIDLTEIQSLDGKEIVTHKVKEAYKILKSPVIVEDSILQFNALGRLPGPYIKWFESELKNEGMCKLLNGYKDRSAIAVVNFAYYDGKMLKIFSATTKGEIAKSPKGKNGFGWDPIYINEGYAITRGQMALSDYDKTSARKAAGQKLANFLKKL